MSCRMFKYGVRAIDNRSIALIAALFELFFFSHSKHSINSLIRKLAANSRERIFGKRKQFLLLTFTSFELEKHLQLRNHLKLVDKIELVLAKLVDKMAVTR